MGYVDVLKALADEKRLQIMCLLIHGSKCVCEIEPALNTSQSSTSKHLIKLKNVGLIQSIKRGQWVHYYIPDEVFIRYPFVKQLIEAVSLERSQNQKERMESVK